jgi:membrane fusion protein, multidrug efflux system
MRLRAIFGALMLLLAVSLSGALVWQLGDASPPDTGRGRHDLEQAVIDDPAIPVVVATAEPQDVPIFLFALGTVQAVNTVTVRSRVDGQLQSLHFREGQDVRAGDVLARLDPRPFEAALRQMEANLRRDQAQLRSAEAELDRTRKLAVRDLASRQSLDVQVAQVQQLEAAIEADQAQIDNAKIQLEYTVIRSPIDGRTGLRLVDEGNMIHASDTDGIVVVRQFQPAVVVFALPEEDLPKINSRLAARGAPAVTALGRDGQTVLAEGTLMTVDNVIDRNTGTFKLKAHFSNEKRTLWPGQFVNARLHLSTRPGSIVVSEATVQHGRDGTYVFVIAPDNTVAMRAIRVAQMQNGIAVIDAGLSPGERVVVEGQHRLQPGSRVFEVKPEKAAPSNPIVQGNQSAKS